LNSKVILWALVEPGVSTFWLDEQFTQKTIGQIYNSFADKDQFYYVRVLNVHGCMDTTKLYLKTISPVVPEITHTPLCKGVPFTLTASVNNTSTYTGNLSWYKNDTLIKDKTDFTLTDVKQAKFKSVYNVASCTSFDTLYTRLNSLPKIDLGELADFCSEFGANFPIKAKEGFKFYKWNDDARFNQSSFVADKAGLITLEVEDFNGCKNRDSLNIIDVCPPRMFVPTAFTPNDTKNNLFTTHGANYDNYLMRIFNRWGEIIFESNDPTVFWDGIYKGEPMPIGVYAWVVSYTGNSDKYKGPYKMQGSVTVIR
jgi:gliding motility-associated-like protein